MEAMSDEDRRAVGIPARSPRPSWVSRTRSIPVCWTSFGGRKRV